MLHLDDEEAIREIKKKNLENNVEDETLEIDEVVNIKESRNHPLENKTRADRGKKRPCEPNASSSSTTQNPSSSSLQIDIITDDNDVESPQSNSSSPSQTISSSSNVVSGVHQNPPHENHDLNNSSYPKTISLSNPTTNKINTVMG
ncbi:hypothetical protein Tco_1475106 [Tanacetum coccineum]